MQESLFFYNLSFPTGVDLECFVCPSQTPEVWKKTFCAVGRHLVYYIYKLSNAVKFVLAGGY